VIENKQMPSRTPRDAL